MSSTTASSINYMPQLDGLRGLATMWVVMGHIELLNGPFRHYYPQFMADELSRVESVFWIVSKFSWIGVDLFFVLSGYLISRILIENIHSPSIFWKFLARRILRVYPLFLAVLGAYFAIAHSIPEKYMAASKLNVYLENQWYIWFQLINFVRENGHYPQGELAHLWSLAIEEQFYFIFPLLLLLIRSFASRHMLLVLTVVLVSMMLSIWCYKWFIYEPNPPDSSINFYFSSILRSESIIWGILIAIYQTSCGSSHARKTLWAATCAIVIGLLVFVASACSAETTHRPFDMLFTGYKQTIQIYGFSGISLMCAGIILMAIHLSVKNPINRFLGLKPLRLYGKHSFSIYLLNPLVVAIPIAMGYTWFWFGGMFSHWILPVYILVFLMACYVLSRLTWALIENPFLKLKNHHFLKLD